MTITIAIIDIIGLPYDGTTVYRQGLGGSESAVTYMSESLAQLGFAVTVFNCCNTDGVNPGVYNRVQYRPLEELAQDHQFDIVISSRTVIPFIPDHELPNLGDARALSFVGMNLYDRILSRASMRVLWMHDTFCLGDRTIEPLALANRITDIFTLSDWHTSYVSTCDHGGKRMYEVLKNKIFMTRNGARSHIDEIDLAAKDPNLYIYNASVTKGMIPLVNLVWPRVKQQLPAARLIVIGGYYRFGAAAEPDAQELTWRGMVSDPKYGALGIEFTGVIPQSEIAQLLAQANFMIYPTSFPETFGISTLESLLYNTPVLTCRFGAMEETAVDMACYKIDYPIEPNSLYPNINTDQQVDRFVDMTVRAAQDTYLHQQRQYYCNAVKPWASWDTVAEQWRQHFYYQLGEYLPRAAYKSVSRINRAVHEVWGRRTHNRVEIEPHREGIEREIVVIVPFYNAADYIEQCIASIAAQDYDNYRCVLINDASTDTSDTVVRRALAALPQDIVLHFEYVVNSTNQGAVYNQVRAIRSIDNPEAIVMLVDGDDALAPDNNIFVRYNAEYATGAEFTYGSCWSMIDNIPLISQPYPDAVKQSGTYRDHRFNWNMPYTHLRTFVQRLIQSVPDTDFQDNSGQWYRAGGDGALFYSLIEQARPEAVRCLTNISYLYNDTNPINDYKVNGVEQTRNANEILTRKGGIYTKNRLNTVQKSPEYTSKNSPVPAVTKSILIAIPTAKYIEVETFKSIYDLIVPAGYTVSFQYFFGYQIDQIRNLIADWVVKGYDYLFSVDSDIAFEPDTLVKLLSHDCDAVTGLYIQRKPGQHIVEVYEENAHGGVVNIDYARLKNCGLVEIAGAGFGCILIKRAVFTTIGYPQFKYHSALNHNDTVSEDVFFCQRARECGFKIWADTSIKCRHIGLGEFVIDDTIAPALVPARLPGQPVKDHLTKLGNQRLIPRAHVDFLIDLRDAGVSPKVIYDIGACVLHWTNEARRIWPQADYCVFDAMDSVEFLYQEQNLKYHIGVLSDSERVVNFYQNDDYPGGNSYYLENADINAEAPLVFNEQHRRCLRTETLDSVVLGGNFPLPDLIKIDTQGAELDILRGAEYCLSRCNHVILELQVVEYNKGAPLRDTVIEYMATKGFECRGLFSDNGPDGDYYFVRAG